MKNTRGTGTYCLHIVIQPFKLNHLVFNYCVYSLCEFMSYLIGYKLPTNNINKYDAITAVTAAVRLDPITRPN